MVPGEKVKTSFSAGIDTHSFFFYTTKKNPNKNHFSLQLICMPEWGSGLFVFSKQIFPREGEFRESVCLRECISLSRNVVECRSGCLSAKDPSTVLSSV